MKTTSSARRRVQQRDREEQSKQPVAKLNDDLRLSKAARQVVEQDVYPLLDLPGRGAAKLAHADRFIANIVHSSRQGKIVRASRNTGTLRNHRVALDAVNALVMGGLVRMRCGFYDHVRMQGKETRYWPTDMLLELLGPAMEADGGVTYRPSDLIVLKDEQKNVIPIPDDLDAATVEYLSARELQIALLNANNSRHVLKYRIWDIAADWFSSKVGRTFSALKAIYNNGSFKQGGRLYADYQNLRRQERSTLTIDDAPTVELDYGCLHPSMLYNGEGLPVPGDAYDIGLEQCGVLRQGIKVAFNALLNARTSKAALAACNLELSDYDRTGAMKPWDEVQKARHLKRAMQLRGLTFKDVLAAVRRQHAPIAKYFGTGWGIRLQNEDVELVYAVCRHFCEQAVPILPVHDSFIVPADYENELRSVMVEAYRSRYAFVPVVKRSDD